MRRPTSALILLAAALAVTAPAQANLLTNSGFEAAGPSFAGAGSYCYLGIGDNRECGTVPGWTGTLQIIAAGSGPWHTPSSIAGFNAAAQGSRIAGLQNVSYMEQLLTLGAGSYTLSWLDSNRSSSSYGGNSYEVRLDGNLLQTYSTRVGDAWDTNRLLFTVDTTGSHRLRLQGLGTSTDGTSFIDNLTLTANPVPEPASGALAALALAGLAASRRRQSGTAG